MPPKDITQTGPVSYRDLQEANKKNSLYGKMLSSLSDSERSARETYFRQKEFHDTVAPTLGTAQLAEETGLPESVVNELSYQLTASGYSTDQIKRLLKNYYTAAHPQGKKPETSTEEVEDTRAPWERQPSYDSSLKLATLPKFDLEAATKSIEATKAREAEEQKVYNDALAEYHRDHPYSDSFASEGINLVNMDIDREAEAYAKERLAEFKQIVPESQNPYRGISTANDVRNRISELSSTYNRIAGTSLLPEDEIKYDELYSLIAPFIAQNRPSAAENAADDYIRKIAGDHQSAGGKWGRSLRKATGNFIETVWSGELLTNIAALGSGLVTAAINPDDYQLASDMSYWDRVKDKARHARLGFIGPGAAKDIADAIRPEGDIYDNMFLENVLPLIGYLTGFSLTGAEDLALTGGINTGSKLLARSVVGAKNARRAATVTDDVLKRATDIKAALYHNKAIRAAMTIHAASTEALGEALQVEEEIMSQAEQLKDGIRARVYQEAYDNPHSYEYSEAELQAAAQEILNEYKEQYGGIAEMVASQLAQYQAENPDVAIDYDKMSKSIEQSIYQDMMRQAQARAAANHALERQGHIIDMAYQANASKMGNATWLAETIELAFMEGVLGGAQSRLMPFRLVKNNMKPSDMSKFITFKDGKFHANLPTGKQFGNAMFERGKDVLSEVIQEGPMQGFTSSYFTYKGEHSAEEFVNNHFFGNGALSMEHYTRNRPSLQELVDDSRLGDVMLETAIGTALAGSFSPRRSFHKREARREGESKFRYAVKNISDYLPFDAPITQTISDVMHQNDEVHDVVNWLNNYYSNPKNQDKVKSVRAFSNYALNLQRDVDNNDAVAYDNDAFSMTLAEAIMLSRLSDSPIYQARIQQLQNMKSIKSGTDEEKADAIKDWREHVTTADAAKLSDEQILDMIEENGNRVLNLFEKVNKQNEILDRTYGTNLSFEDRAMRLFGIFAQEDLQSRIKDKQNYIDGMAKLIADEDLGETRESKINWGKKSTYKGIQLSGQDIMRLPNKYRWVMLNPANRSLFSEEQQKIIENTLDALRAVDTEMTVEQDIKDIVEMEVTSTKIKNEYQQTLKNLNKPPQKFEKQKKERLSRILNNPDKTARKFQERASQAQSVQELKQVYDQEVAANDERKASKQFDVDKALNDIQDPEVKKKVAELNKMQQASNSIGAAISSSSLPLELKENLLGQVEGLMNSQNSASALYDIANYSLSGVRPDEKDKMAGELSQILSSAKSTAANAQTVYTNPVDSKKDSQFGQATDLSSRDVDTAPAVNKEPIKKFTPEEAAKLVNEINALLAKNEFMTATPMINELQKRCPEGYQFMQGGTQVALKKIDTSTPISEVTVDESLEEEPEFVPEGEVIVDEELDSSLDAYPDEDVRSITKIAIVTFEPGGREYAYPVRDEDVQMGDTVDGKSNQGKIERFETPDEYAVKHPDGDYTLEKLAKFKRGTFIDRHTNKAEAAEPVPVKRVVTTHRSETQQSRLNANVTPARSEVSHQHIKDGSMTRLGDTNHTNIDTQLDENGAFRYVDEGMLNQDDELVFVVTEEEMPDGQKAPVIWEVTKSKTEYLPTDGKFLGYQVINVLDQTSMGGDRGELIARIREAYEKAGKPASFLYDSEPVKVKNIVKGFIPTRQTNPVDAQSQETIASTNLKQGLVKSNGRWGVMFKSSKTGKLMHVPVVLRQIKRDIDGNIKPSISHTGIDTIETIKHNPLTQDETREVMLVVPTPTGWQAAHSVYVLKRDIQDAVENYKEAINNGVLGERLIAKAMLRFTDPKATTAFSDFLRFNRGTSERIVFDSNHNRLELGIRGNLDTTFVYASKRGETWVITEADARNILDDNEGKGFTTEEVLKRYLNALADSEDAGISVQMNMDAISKDNSIIDALIEDGFLWAPNSYPGRLTMENVGFEAPLSETAEAEPKVEDNITTKPEPAITAPKPSNPVIGEPVTTTQKIKVPDSVDSNDVGAMVPRKKKSSSSEKKISITPTTPRTEQASTQEAPLMDELKVEAKKSYNELSAESKAHLEEKGISQEEWDKHPEIHENVLNC